MLEGGLYMCRRMNYLSANPDLISVLRYQIINSYADYSRNPEKLFPLLNEFLKNEK
jgi:hypothetical protein